MRPSRCAGRIPRRSCGRWPRGLACSRRRCTSPSLIGWRSRRLGALAPGSRRHDGAAVRCGGGRRGAGPPLPPPPPRPPALGGGGVGHRRPSPPPNPRPGAPAPPPGPRRRLGRARPAARGKVALVAQMRGIGGLGDYGEMHVANRRYVGLAPLEPQAHGDLCNVALVVDEARDGRKIAGRAEAFLLESLATFPGLHRRLAGAAIVRKTLATSGLCTRVRRLSGTRLLLAVDGPGD